jgi:hypothetical protein
MAIIFQAVGLREWEPVPFASSPFLRKPLIQKTLIGSIETTIPARLFIDTLIAFARSE